MENIIRILQERDGLDREEAIRLIKETSDEIAMNPSEAEEIMLDYLGLEPDYIEDLMCTFF